MATRAREVHFFGGPLDGVRTHRFGADLRALGAFRVEASHGGYQHMHNAVLDEEFDPATNVISGGYDVWTWESD